MAEYNAVTSGNRNKILQMLGKGLTPAVVATAAGVSESYISQLLSEDEFAREVTELRFNSLQAHTDRDAKWDSLEDQLLDKMQDLLVYMVKPGEVLKALQVVNGAKRRGTDPMSSGQGAMTNQTIINLVLPKTIVSTFSTNQLGQVVEATHSTSDGEAEKQSLVTIQSNSVKNLLGSRLPQG